MIRIYFFTISMVVGRMTIDKKIKMLDKYNWNVFNAINSDRKCVHISGLVYTLGNYRKSG